MEYVFPLSIFFFMTMVRIIFSVTHMKDVVFLLDIVIFPTKVKEFIILAKMFMLKKYTLNKNQNLFMIQC